MKQAQVSVQYVVEVDLRIRPGVAVVQTATNGFGRDFGGTDAHGSVRRHVLAGVELSREHLDSHDGKDEPEDEADEEDVGDRRNRLHECVHDDLGSNREPRVTQGTMQTHSLSSFAVVRLYV